MNAQISYPPPSGSTCQGPPFSGYGPGETAFVITGEDDTNPGGNVTVLSVSVPADETYYVSMVKVTCRRQVVYTVNRDSDKIGSGRLGAAQSNDTMDYEPHLLVQGGSTLEVVIEALPGKSAQPAEVYITGFKI